MFSRCLSRGPVEQLRIHTAADRELLERAHFKRNLPAATEVGVGVPNSGLKSLSVPHRTQASHVPHLLLQVLGPGCLPLPQPGEHPSCPGRASCPPSLAGFEVKNNAFPPCAAYPDVGCQSREIFLGDTGGKGAPSLPGQGPYLRCHPQAGGRKLSLC